LFSRGLLDFEAIMAWIELASFPGKNYVLKGLRCVPHLAARILRTRRPTPPGVPIVKQAEFAFVPMTVAAPPPNPRLQRIRRIQELAAKLIRAHGLSGWKFAYNRRKRAMGYCCYSLRSIELSIHFVVHNDMDAIVDTLLHEIAHALVGSDHGHDKVWKAKCRQVGATPQRLGQANMPAGKWQANCKSCGRLYHRHRRPKRMQGWYCPPCGADLGRLVWKQLSRPR
jgi:predicted SprT family Zn-dependent metalloprotease